MLNANLDPCDTPSAEMLELFWGDTIRSCLNGNTNHTVLAICIDLLLLSECEWLSWWIIAIGANVCRLEDIPHILFQVVLGVGVNRAT